MEEQSRRHDSVDQEEQRAPKLPRICRIVYDYPVDGKPTYGLQPVFYYLSKEQARRGYEMHVIARRQWSQPPHESCDGVIIHRVSDPFTVNAIRTLRNLTSDRKETIVHTHGTAGLFMAAVKRYFRVSLVSHVHGSSRSHAIPVVLKVGDTTLGYSAWGVANSYLRERTLWTAADRVAAVSNAVRDDLVSHYGISPDKTRVVYNGVDPNLFRPIPNAEIPNMPELRGKKVVLYVGHFGFRKGLIHLIKAMGRVTEEVPESVLVCIGGVPGWLGKSEYWRYTKDLIRISGLERKIFLLDKIPNPDLPLFYSACAVFVLPSYYESFAKVLVEAMACGKPVVATSSGGPVEVVDGQGLTAGLLVEFGAERQLANALISILQDDRKAREMGANGRKRVLADFTWKRVGDRVDQVYHEVMNGTSVPGRDAVGF
jgi:glycosyltransferase involved in cell wall biosynthesis